MFNEAVTIGNAVIGESLGFFDHILNHCLDIEQETIFGIFGDGEMKLAVEFKETVRILNKYAYFPLIIKLLIAFD